MKNNRKGFTLIELLAVIVILGLLMAIAIPSVTRYITQSRRKTVVTSINSYVTSVLNQVNDGEYKFSDSTKIYAIPIECIPLEKGGTNPFGNWLQANEAYWAYVLVQYDNENYNYTYGFTFKDDAGYGMYPTSHANIDESGKQVKTGYDDLNKPETGLAIEFVTEDKWTGFNVTTSTDLVVLEAESEGVPGNGETTCTLCQKGDNYEQVESDKNNNNNNEDNNDNNEEDNNNNDENDNRLSSLIMKHNPDIKINPTLTTTSQEAGENGVYSSTATNSGNPTYYFRGNVTNNYVSFAGQTWRIIRINEDGTVRLIMQNGIDNNSHFNRFTSNKGYSYMYYSNGSNAKTQVDNWYKTNITDKGYDSYVSTGTFCEQAKVKISSSYTSGSATMAIYTAYTPNFKCSTDGNGKGIINSKAGLINIDEVIHAGGSYVKYNTSYYLKNGYGFWTMSPAGYYSSNIYVWTYNTQGGCGAKDSVNVTYLTYTFRPVINLNADVTATGTGISTDPYVIQTN